MTASGYQLTIGSLPLHEYTEPGGTWSLKLRAAESDFGNPVPVVDMVESLLRDGSLTRTTRDGNRHPAFLLEVWGEDRTARAEAVAAVDAELYKINELLWEGPDGPDAIIEVTRSSSDELTDVQLEIIQGIRMLRLNFECLPYTVSVGDTVINYTGPSSVLKAVTSATGWAVSTGTRTATTNGGVACIQCSAQAPTITVTDLGVLDDFLWLRVNNRGSVDAYFDLDLTITTPLGSTVIPDEEIFNVGIEFGDSERFLLMADTSPWKGVTPTSISFKMNAGGGNVARIYGLDTMSYPNLPALDLPDAWSSSEVPTGTLGRGPAHADFGIGAFDVGGTARTGCTFEFTVPTGGAFVITGPDPVPSLREQGRSEAVFGVFTITDANGEQVDVGEVATYFPPGDHATWVGTTGGQMAALNPDGIWPESGTGSGITLGDDTSATMYSYPTAFGTAVSYFDTVGAKILIAPGLTLPEGYSDGALTYEDHALYPGRSLIAILDIDGVPIDTTITYRKRWEHHPAEAG